MFKKRKTFGPLIYSIELHSGGLELRATELQLLDYHDWFDSSGWNFSKIASDLLLQLIGIAISWHGYRSCSATLLPLCSQKYKWVWMNGQGNLIKWQGGGGEGVGVVNEQLFRLHMIVFNIFFLVSFLPLKMTMENPLYESSTKWRSSETNQICPADCQEEDLPTWSSLFMHRQEFSNLCKLCNPQGYLASNFSLGYYCWIKIRFIRTREMIKNLKSSWLFA